MPPDRSSSRLLVLGSAAVIAVYGVGFERTRAAATQLEGESQSRQRPDVPAAAPVVESTVASAAAESVPTAVVPTAVVATPITVAKAAIAADTTTTAVVAKVDTVVALTTTKTTTDSAATKVAQWRDGTFKGWGNSRHGSIEATIVIVEGRITEAYISDCRTRYSCSWVEHLPAQVVARQSQEVDYVSGATQSANAFYYAVGEALAKAR